MNVMLIFGGDSYEHEVSIITGCLVSNLLKNKYNIYPVYIDRNNDLFYNNADIESFRNKKFGKKVEFSKNGFKSKLSNFKMDIAIICTHGLNGEDGQIKGMLDFYKIPSIGSNLISSAVNMDKYYSYCILKENGINVVESTFITKDSIRHEIDYPIILKPARLGSSIGISVCFNEQEYLEKVYECFKYDSKILVQKYFQNIEELNVSVYENKEEIVTSKVEVVKLHEEIYSYEDKYSKCKLEKRHFLTNSLEKEIKDISKKVYKIFELNGIVRIDYMIYEDNIYLNEINTIPGSLSYYLYDKEFDRIIKELITKELFDRVNKRKVDFKSNILFHDYNMKK